MGLVKRPIDGEGEKGEMKNDFLLKSLVVGVVRLWKSAFLRLPAVDDSEVVTVINHHF